MKSSALLTMDWIKIVHPKPQYNAHSNTTVGEELTVIRCQTSTTLGSLGGRLCGASPQIFST